MTLLSLPATNALTPTCVTGTETLYGTLSVAENGASAEPIFQGRSPFPADWAGAIEVDVKWRTSATTGNVVRQIQTACVVDAKVGDPSFNAAQCLAANAAKGAPLQCNNVTRLTSLTTTGCAVCEELLFKFLCDATHASDTVAAAAELITLSVRYLRAQ